MTIKSTYGVKLLLCLALFPLVASIAQPLTTAQIKQIEEIAQTTSTQHNANSRAMLDEMTVSTHAEAVGRNIRFQYVVDPANPLLNRPGF